MVPRDFRAGVRGPRSVERKCPQVVGAKSTKVQEGEDLLWGESGIQCY